MNSNIAQTPPLSLTPLFTPFRCGALRLTNRFVMSPMTRAFSPDHVLSPEAPAYYARRVTGGCNMVVTEGVAIPHPVSHLSNRIPNLSDASRPRWKLVADAVHQAGGAIMAQLWHAGPFRYRQETLNPDMPSIAASAIEGSDAREMSERDIAAVIDAYAQAAVQARAAGLDGVEIHGAHGYLPDQFFWHETNRRTDGYGGPITNRVRFACELVAEIRRRTAPDFPIMFRFLQWKQDKYEARVAETPQELEAWLVPLAEAGVDIFDASTRRFWLPEFPGSPLNLAGWAKKVTGKASMTVGSVGLESPLEVSKIGEMKAANLSLANLSLLLEMFARGDFDLVALGRIILTNPDWPLIAQSGRYAAISPYDPKAVAERLECGL